MDPYVMIFTSWVNHPYEHILYLVWWLQTSNFTEASHIRCCGMGACACTICWEIIGDANRRGGDAMRGGGDADLSHHLCVARFIMQMMNLQGTWLGWGYVRSQEGKSWVMSHERLLLSIICCRSINKCFFPGKKYMLRVFLFTLVWKLPTKHSF